MKHQSILATSTQRADKVENNLGLSGIEWRKLAAKTLKLAKPLKELTCGEKALKATAASLLQALNSTWTAPARKQNHASYPLLPSLITDITSFFTQPTHFSSNFTSKIGVIRLVKWEIEIA